MNKANLLTISSFCFLFIGNTNLSAQSGIPGSMPLNNHTAKSLYEDVQTPQASSLGAYGQIPVTYFTGSPGVSIPLYNFRVRDLEVPISLDYDTKGVLVNNLPGIAGQNWTLNAGGVITRSVKGFYDEWKYPKQAYLAFNNYFESYNMLNALYNSRNDGTIQNTIEYNKNDLSADIYHFNFMGKTGTFFLGSDGSWHVECDQNLEVLTSDNYKNNLCTPLFSKYPNKSAIEQDQPKTIAGFKIRDDQGYTYIFGYDRNAIEYTTNFWRMTSYEDIESWHANSWYLTKIIDKYGNDLVDFSYDRGAYILQVFNSYYNDIINSKSKSGDASEKHSNNNSSFPFTFSIVSPVYLSHISCSSGVDADIVTKYVDDSMGTDSIYYKLYKRGGSMANFYHELGAMANFNTTRPDPNTYPFYYLESNADSLNEFRYTPKHIDQYNILSRTRLKKLHYIRFSSKTAESQSWGYYFFTSVVNRRLRLDSIRLVNRAINYCIDAGRINSYKFSYYKFEDLPEDYLTMSSDHWGYYNGKEFNLNDIFRSGDYVNFKKNRDPNFDFTRIGILEKIQYPTGGYDLIEYEPNDFSQYLSKDRQSMKDSSGVGGGLRVKTITSYDSPYSSKVLQIRSYEYKNPVNGMSSGELFSVPLYYWPQWSIKCINGRCKMETFHTSSIVPLANSLEPSVGYKWVTETTRRISDGNNPLQKKVYMFSNLSDKGCRDQRAIKTYGYDAITPFDEYSDVSFTRGRLLYTATYNKDNHKCSSTAYKYRNDDFLENNYVLTSNLEYIGSTISAQLSYFIGGIYKLYFPKFDVVEEQDTVFSETNNINIVNSSAFNNKDFNYVSGYPYRHVVNLRLPISKTLKRGSQSQSENYKYGNFINPSNKNKDWTDSVLYERMFSVRPQEIEYLRNGYLISTTKTIYLPDYFNNNFLLAPKTVTSTNYFNQTDTIQSWNEYTRTGQPTKYKEFGKPELYLLWGYHDNYLLMKSYSMIYDSITDAEVANPQKCYNKELNYIKLQNSPTSGYVYDFMHGLVKEIFPNGNVRTFTYDDVDRLTSVKDLDGNKISSYEYNYTN